MRKEAVSGWVFALVFGAFAGENFARAEQSSSATVVEVSAKFSCAISPTGESTPESRVKTVQTVAQTPSGQTLSIQVVCDNGTTATFKAATGMYLVKKLGTNWVHLTAVAFAPLLAKRN
jgi:hypothetical protein